MGSDGHGIDRRHIIGAGAALGIASALGLPRMASAQAAPLDALAKAAEGEGQIVWYESSPQDQADKIVRAFTQRFPRLKLRHIRLVGGVDIAARILQEAQADAPTADVGTTGPDQAWKLKERNLLAEIDWASHGVDAKLIATPFAVGTTSAVYVFLYNTKQVAEKDAPKDWEDLLDPKWQGRIGTWANAHALAHLAKAWGEERTTRYVERLAAQKPLLFKSTFPLAQAVGAGEAAAGIGIYHSSQPPIRAGAPIRLVSPEPTPVSTVYSFASRTSKNPNGARLLVAWLASPEGAKAYEDATDRGIHLLPSTRTAQMLAGRTASEFPPEETEAFSRILSTYNNILKQGGKDAG